MILGINDMMIEQWTSNRYENYRPKPPKRERKLCVYPNNNPHEQICVPIKGSLHTSLWKWDRVLKILKAQREKVLNAEREYWRQYWINYDPADLP